MNQSSTPLRTRSRSEEKRQQIVQAASQLFAQQGYLSTSMDQLAEAAGVSKQTVYSHFGTKEDLFKHCIKQRCIANAMDEKIFNDALSLRDNLLQFALHFQDLIMSRDAIQLCRLCAANAEQHPEISAMFHSAGPEQVEASLKGFLARKMSAGEFSCQDLDIACNQLMCLCKGGNHFLALLGLPCPDNQQKMHDYLSHSIDMFLSYYHP